jgi:hypothetical protein
MAEDFGASPHSPQVACLTGLRQSDVVVLILGESYGAIQPSGLSATHEEYRDAKERKPVLAFVHQGVDRDKQEAEFVREVQGWEGGIFRGSFSTPQELTVALTRALHDLELANAVGPVNQQDLKQRVLALLPTERRGYSSGSATLSLAVAGAPLQSILRPVEIETPELADALHQAALFGERRIFDFSMGVQRQIDGDALVLTQERGSSRLLLNEQGSVLVTLPVRESSRMMPELVHEFVQEQISNALGYASWVLERVDPTQRLTHIAAALCLSNANHLGWRSQRESEENPNRISLSAAGSGERAPVEVSRTRAALRLDSARIVEDLIIPLRRQWR